jgi:hypothetical protein
MLALTAASQSFGTSPLKENLQIDQTTDAAII